MENETENKIELPVMTAPSPPKLTRGRIVEYIAQDGSHQGLEGGTTYPAIVVRAFSDTCATIAVFTEDPAFPVHTITSVMLGNVPGTWNWPVRGC